MGKKTKLFTGRPGLFRKLYLKWKFDWKYLHRDIKIGIKNIFKWLPIIWRDRDWDSYYMYEIMEFKIIQFKKLHKKNKRYVGWENNVKWMNTCIKLIKKVKDEYYTYEPTNYSDKDFWFEDIEDKPGYSEFKSEIKEENYDEYFSKYPREFNKTLKKYPNLSIKTPEDKSRTASYLSMEIQEKARRTLFNILNKKLPGWWD